MGAKSIIPVPEKFKVFYDQDKMVIRRKWFGLHLLFLIPFTVFWDAFIVGWFYYTIQSEAYFMTAFGAIHGLVGVGLTYFVICCFTNATDISVDAQYLELKHHPYPWPGSKKILSVDITQLHCEEKVTHGKHGPSVSYTVKVIGQQGKGLKLISGLSDASEAKFIEQKVESILGIQNQPVSGEI